MTKILLSVCALLFTTITFAQQPMMVDMPVKKQVKMHIENAQPTNFQSGNSIASTPIWSEDFSSGFPASWTTYTNNTGSGNGGTPANPPNIATCPWKHSTQGSWGYWNSEPKDANNNPMNAAPAINSTSAADGFLISDIDSANHWSGGGATGTSSGSSSGSTYHYLESYFTTSAIDLSMFPDVSLQFEQTFRYNNLGSSTPSLSPPTVYVSSDSINWTPFLVNGSVSGPIANNTQSSDPDVKILNISPQAGGQSTVYLRFGWTARCYFWMIDDIKIIETPKDLIAIEDIVFGGYWLDYTNYTGAGLNTVVGLDYSITPLSQLANHPYVIEGVIRNLGSSDQNSMLKYEVTGSNFYSGSSQPISVLATSSSNTVDSVIVGTTPLSPSIGVYTIATWAESDSAISDTVYKGIEISDYIYGKDLGDANPGSYLIGGPSDQNHLITRYEMYADEQLYSLRTYISDNSNVGAEIKAIIYEFDSTATGTNGKLFYEESDNYIITAQDLGTWVDIPFVSPVSLFNGYAYSCGVVGFQHPTDSSYIGTSGGSMYNGEHNVFDEFGLSTQSAGTPTWYYTTRSPMVRLNFDPSSATVQTFNCVGTSCVDPGDGTGSYFSLSICQANCTSTGLEETELGFSIYPNPSEGIFAIKLDAFASYDLTVYNVLGQPVLTKFTDKLITTIDLSSFEKGIYTVELKDKETIYIERVIVE